MSTIKLAFDRLESRLQSLVENSMARLFPGSCLPQELSYKLTEIVRSSITQESKDATQLPNLFIIMVHPDQAQILQGDAIFTEGLRQALCQAAREISPDIQITPALCFEADPGLAQGEVRVLARNSLNDLSLTDDMVISLENHFDENPTGAFLIVDGTRIFPLEQAVVNIGRRPDNQLVLDDLRVSRLHAQLRVVQGRYVIFDLDSAGGTWVNGKRVNQQTLTAGDVISLSGVPVVFGQDNPAIGETQEYVPSV